MQVLVNVQTPPPGFEPDGARLRPARARERYVALRHRADPRGKQYRRQTLRVESILGVYDGIGRRLS